MVYGQGHVAFGHQLNSLSKLDTVWLTNQLSGACRPHYGSIKNHFHANCNATRPGTPLANCRFIKFDSNVL